MMRNLNGYNGQVKQYMKEYLFKVVMRALRECRDNNPAHEDAFNSLIFDLKKKNLHCDRISVDGQGSTARTLFTEENSDGENV